MSIQISKPGLAMAAAIGLSAVGGAAGAQVSSINQSVVLHDLRYHVVDSADSTSKGALSIGVKPNGSGGLDDLGGLGNGSSGYAATSVVVRPDVQVMATASGGTYSANATSSISYFAFVTGVTGDLLVPLHLIGNYDLSSSGTGQATIAITTRLYSTDVLGEGPVTVERSCNRGRGTCVDDQHFDLMFHTGYPVINGPLEFQVYAAMVTLMTAASVSEGAPFGNDARAFIDPIVTIDDAFLATHPNARVTLSEGLGNSFTDAGAVPEPASWTLMIAGFGLAGAALRRRRRLVAA